VPLDGLDRHEQRVGDLPVRKAGGDERRHAPFARRQQFRGLGRAPLAGCGTRVGPGPLKPFERQRAQRVGGAQVAGDDGFAALSLEARGAQDRKGFLEALGGGHAPLDGLAVTGDRR
jgi:hypothetical protein